MSAWARLAGSVATSGGSQNFLGAPWVPLLLRSTPKPFRTKTALWLLSLSPHYFFSSDRLAEHDRLRRSRERLVQDLLAPYVGGHNVVLDYGCGPGYMAVALARRAQMVEGVDISRGVLACAQWLNGGANIIYETLDAASFRRQPVDLAYSFAVVQHLTDKSFRRALSLLRLRLRPGGMLLLHFAPPTDRWRTEPQWRADTSIKGVAKLRLGLNCFGRTDSDMERLVAGAGLSVLRIEPIAGKTAVDDEIANQRWLVASMPLAHPSNGTTRTCE